MERGGRGDVWWWDGLCCQLPPKTWFSSNNYHYLFPSLTIRDESVMMTSVSFTHCWCSAVFSSVFPHLPSLGDSTRAIQVLSGGGGFISEQPCVCSHWSAVCVNTEPSAHSANCVFGQCVKWIRSLDRERYYFECSLLFAQNKLGLHTRTRWLQRANSVFPSGASWICLRRMRRQRRGPHRFTPPAPPARPTSPGWTATGAPAYVSARLKSGQVDDAESLECNELNFTIIILL